MGHDRTLVIGAVALVPGRVRRDIAALSAIRDELEAALREDNWPAVAPFRWVGLIVRYGTRWNLIPEFQRINKKHGDLPIAVEVPMSEVRGLPLHELESLFRYVTMESLIAVAHKFELPTTALLKRRESKRWFPRSAV